MNKTKRRGNSLICLRVLFYSITGRKALSLFCAEKERRLLFIKEVAEDKKRGRKDAPDHTDGVESEEGLTVGTESVVELHPEIRHERVGERDGHGVKADGERTVFFSDGAQQHLQHA